MPGANTPPKLIGAKGARENFGSAKGPEKNLAQSFGGGRGVQGGRKGGGGPHPTPHPQWRGVVKRSPGARTPWEPLNRPSTPSQSLDHPATPGRPDDAPDSAAPEPNTLSNGSPMSDQCSITFSRVLRMLKSWGAVQFKFSSGLQHPRRERGVRRGGGGAV